MERYMKKLLLVCCVLLLSFNSFADKGQGSGNGGHYIGISFVREAKLGIQMMQASGIGSGIVDYSELNRIASELNAVVLSDPKDLPIIVKKNGVKQESVARAYKKKRKYYVEIDAFKWNAITNDLDRRSQAVHEILTLSKKQLETTFRYDYSSELTLENYPLSDQDTNLKIVCRAASKHAYLDEIVLNVELIRAVDSTIIGIDYAKSSSNMEGTIMNMIEGGLLYSTWGIMTVVIDRLNGADIDYYSHSFLQLMYTDGGITALYIEDDENYSATDYYHCSDNAEHLFEI